MTWLDGTYRDPARRRAVLEAYRAQIVPAGQNGSLILGDLMKYCRFGHSSFVPGDPHQTAFNEGARDVLLHIFSMIGLRPDELVKGLSDAE